ncbi:MAG: hypothetical protein ACFFAN_07880 [Promethearchaeota archaeon]
MEIIEKSLYENEKILWRNTRYEKQHLILIFLMVMIPLIFGNIFFIFLSINAVYYYLVFVFIIDGVIIPFIVVEYIRDLKEKKKGKLSWKDLNKHQNITILTNKRWIQKDLSFLRLDFEKYSKKGMELHRDIAFINLNLIKFIEVHESRLKDKDYYAISLYFSYNKKEPEGIQLRTLFRSTHSTPKYEEFLKSIKKILQIKKEEHNEIAKSLKYYYLYF